MVKEASARALAQDGASPSSSKFELRGICENATAAMVKAIGRPHKVQTSIRRRPRSTKNSATMVKRKFVPETIRLAAVGLVRPTGDQPVSISHRF